MDALIFSILVVLRTDGDPAAAPAIRKELSTVDPTQSFFRIRTMEQAIADSAPRRFNLLLLGTFALVAFAAGLGVYGVVVYTAAERTQEIGIRLAGAERCEGRAHDRDAGHVERRRWASSRISWRTPPRD